MILLHIFSMLDLLQKVESVSDGIVILSLSVSDTMAQLVAFFKPEQQRQTL